MCISAFCNQRRLTMWGTGGVAWCCRKVSCIRTAGIVARSEPEIPEASQPRAFEVQTETYLASSCC